MEQTTLDKVEKELEEYIEGSLLQGRERLEASIKAGSVAPLEDIKSLALKDIHLRPDVFQHRRCGHVDSDVHANELAKSLQRNPKQPLAPIVIYWIGDGWCCIDGHHRLEAYQRVKYKDKVPVKIFKGDLDNAIAEALRGNSRDKLPMRAHEKSEAAWRLVISTKLPKAVIANASNRSERLVGYMREARLVLLKSNPNIPLDSLKWVDALALSKGKELAENEWGDDAIEVKAQTLANNMCRALGRDKLSVSIEVTARALEIISPQLPFLLAEYWKDYAESLDLEHESEYAEEAEAEF